MTLKLQFCKQSKQYRLLEHNSLRAGSLWGRWPPTRLWLHAPVAPGRPVRRCPIVLWPGGRWGQGGRLVPKTGNKSPPPKPGLSIQLGLLMGTQGAWREQAAFPGRVRKLPCAGPMPSCRLWGPILEASSGRFLALSALCPHSSRTTGAQSPRAACTPPLSPKPGRTLAFG